MYKRQDTWKPVGTLGKTVNEFVLPNETVLLDVKIEWSDAKAVSYTHLRKYPHNIYVDFGAEKSFQSLRYQQRVDAQGNPTVSGHVKSYKIYTCLLYTSRCV